MAQVMMKERMAVPPSSKGVPSKPIKKKGIDKGKAQYKDSERTYISENISKDALRKHKEYIETLLLDVEFISGIFLIGVGYQIEKSVVIHNTLYRTDESKLSDIISCLRLRGDQQEIKISIVEELMKPVYYNRQLAIDRYSFATGDSKNNSSFVVMRKGGLVEGCLSTVEEAINFCKQLTELGSSPHLRITDFIIEEWYHNRLLNQIQFFQPIVLQNKVDTSEDRQWITLKEGSGSNVIDVQIGLETHLRKGKELSEFYWPFKQLTN